jgi:hypothetical protein
LDVLGLGLELKNAIQDFRYLLDRGYKRESALKFVGDRYQLNRLFRLLLYRCVYGRKEAKKHQRKIVSQKFVLGKVLAVDGYNTLITIESVLEDKPTILCDDGFIRDLSAVHGKHKPTQTTLKALKLLAKTLLKSRVKEVKFFFDSQVSHSGELASLTRKTLLEFRLTGDASAVKQADNQVLGFGDVVASSDAVVIKKAKKVFDLAGATIKKEKLGKVLKLDNPKLQEKLTIKQL